MRARDGEKRPILSSRFLICNWSTACQMQRTHPWSSSQNGWVGKGSVCQGQMGWTEQGLANKPKQAVSNKNFLPTCRSPILLQWPNSLWTCPGQKPPCPPEPYFGENQESLVNPNFYKLQQAALVDGGEIALDPRYGWWGVTQESPCRWWGFTQRFPSGDLVWGKVPPRGVGPSPNCGRMGMPEAVELTLYKIGDS